jgi:hypothetical protein
MSDGRVLELPIRDHGDVGMAGLIANQASFEVVHALVGRMAEAEAEADLPADVVVGLPTLGQVFAPLLAELLGHANWVAAGYTQKRWYGGRLSVPIASSTGPVERRGVGCDLKRVVGTRGGGPAGAVRGAAGGVGGGNGAGRPLAARMAGPSAASRGILNPAAAAAR